MLDESRDISEAMPADGDVTTEESTATEEQRLGEAAERVRLRFKGVRVRVTGIPNSRKVSDVQKARAAESIGADVRSVSMSSLLWDCKVPAVKEFRAVVSAITRTFHDRSLTLPSCQDGLRMIKKDKVGEFHRRMLGYKAELAARAVDLKNALPDIIEHERQRRGEAFNVADYAFDPTVQCEVRWWFPSVTEDSELAELDDEVYQAELRRVRSDLSQAVQQHEAQVAEGLYEMVDTIVERLTGRDTGKRNGKRKVFKDETVAKVFDELDFMSEQLMEFRIGGGSLKQAADKLRETLQGQSRDTLPAALRRSDSFAEHMRQQLSNVAEELLQQAVPPQRRSLLRKRSATGDG